MLSVGLAFFVFIVARYVAGMTRLDLWRPLRAGAAYLVGATLLLLLLIAATGLAYVGYGPAFPLLALVAPAITAVLGVEMLLAFLADLYRPRRKGEIPRPAFDSRLLGWMTSPDSLSKIVAETLRYQFGVDFTSSWFYRLFSRALVPLIVVGVAVLFAMSSLVIVSPQQAAVVTTFGQLERNEDGSLRVYTPGVHLKWPWPVSGIEKYDVHRVHRLNVGSRTEGVKQGVAILWTNEHTVGEEQYLVTAPTQIDRERGDAALERQARGAAGELVGADVVFLYQIDPQERLEHYISSANEPEAMLQAIAEKETSRYFATRTVDQLLTVGRQQAGEAIRGRTQAAVEARGLGLEVLQVAISAVHPPNDSEVAQTFLEQINARQTMQTTIEEARREAVSVLAQTAGSRDFALRINRPIQREEALLREIERLRREAGEDGGRGGPANHRNAAGAAPAGRGGDRTPDRRCGRRVGAGARPRPRRPLAAGDLRSRRRRAVRPAARRVPASPAVLRRPPLLRSHLRRHRRPPQDHPRRRDGAAPRDPLQPRRRHRRARQRLR